MAAAALRLIFCLGIAASGCRSASEQTCGQRLGPLRAKVTQLKAITELPNYFGWNTALAPTAARYRPMEADTLGSLVKLTGGRLWFDGRDLGAVSSDDAIKTYQEDLVKRRLWLATQSPEMKRGVNIIYVVAPADRTLAELLRLADATSEPHELRLVVRSAEELPSPISATASQDLRERVRSIEALPTLKERAGPLGALTAEALAGCAAARALMLRVQDAGPIFQSRTLLEGIIPALEECKCGGVDLDKLEAASMLLLRPSGPASGWLPLVPRRLHDIDAAGAKTGELTIRYLVTRLLDDP